MLSSHRLSLRPLERSDLEKVARWRNAADTARWFFNAFPIAVSGQGAWYDDLLRRQDRSLLVIELKGGGPIGTIGFDHIDWRNRKAELGNVLIGEPEQRGKGLAKEAVATMVDFGFNHLNLHRIFLEVFADNDAAVGLYRACGFEVEGTLRQSAFALGEFRDTLIMACLRNRWSGAQG